VIWSKTVLFLNEHGGSVVGVTICFNLWGLEWLGDWLPIVNVLQNLEVWTT
jgi:hypothetical protein